MSDDINDYLNRHSNSGPPAVKWETVGDVHGGTITGAKVVPTENGEALVIAVLNAEGDEASLWIKYGQMTSALQRALAESKPNGKIEAGDKVAITFTGTNPPKKAGFSPQKVYEVQYRAGAAPAAAAPAAARSASDLLG